MPRHVTATNYHPIITRWPTEIKTNDKGVSRTIFLWVCHDELVCQHMDLNGPLLLCMTIPLTTCVTSKYYLKGQNFDEKNKVHKIDDSDNTDGRIIMIVIMIMIIIIIIMIIIFMIVMIVLMILMIILMIIVMII